MKTINNNLTGEAIVAKYLKAGLFNIELTAQWQGKKLPIVHAILPKHKRDGIVHQLNNYIKNGFHVSASIHVGQIGHDVVSVNEVETFITNFKKEHISTGRKEIDDRNKFPIKVTIEEDNATLILSCVKEYTEANIKKIAKEFIEQSINKYKTEHWNMIITQKTLERVKKIKYENNK